VNEALPHLGDQILHQPDHAEHDEYLQKLEPVSRANLGLEKAGVAFGDGIRGAGRKASGRNVLLQQSILLVPSLAEPHVEFLLVFQRNIRDAEPSPVEVDRFWWLPSQIGAGKGEQLFAKLAAAKSQCQEQSISCTVEETYGTPS
jgi:hypothetical protein